MNTLTTLDYIRCHQYLYYCKTFPVISDSAYDELGKWYGTDDYKGGSDMESSYTELQKTTANLMSGGKHSFYPPDYPESR